MTQSKTLFGHPKGLFYLFFAELWERFSFYGMKALLVLYMTKKLLFSDEMSFGVFAAYMSLVYVTPLIGGMLADKYLGFRKAIMLGGVLMAFGHLFLTIETPIFFYGSLGLIIVGNGLFKPNISSFVGDLYSQGDSRRDAGFTIFYLGVNIGATVAPLLCAYLAEKYGWHLGFAAAGVGMMIGLLFFQSGIKRNIFQEKGNMPNTQAATQKNWVKIIIGAVLAAPVFALITCFYQYEHLLLWAVSVFLIVALIMIYRKVSNSEKSRLIVIVYFTLLATVFMVIFEQAGSSLTLFADRSVNLVGISAAQTNSINAGYIMLLAIPFAVLWTFLEKIKKNPHSGLKMGIGLVLLGAGFLVFASSAYSVNLDGKVPMIYLFLGYLVLTIGELFLSPIGLSKMTELSPQRFISFVMGIWFLSSFYGHFFAGKIAQMTTVSDGTLPWSEGIAKQLVYFMTGLDANTIEAQGTAMEQLYSYVSVYAVFGSLAILIGIIAMLLTPFIQKMARGIN